MRYSRTNFFEVYYDIVDEKIIEEIINIIDSTYKRVVNDFRIAIPIEKYSFYLCRDVKEYIAQTGKVEEEYQDWMVGRADYNLKKLCILSPRVVTERSTEDMRKVIIHEIVHIALDSLGNPDETNIFLAEGVAVAYADQIELSNLDIEKYSSISDTWDEDGFYENKVDIFQYVGSTFEHDAIAII